MIIAYYFSNMVFYLNFSSVVIMSDCKLNEQKILFWYSRTLFKKLKNIDGSILAQATDWFFFVLVPIYIVSLS